MKILAIHFVVVAALLILAAQQRLFASSATWDTNPSSGDWNTPANWMPETVPNGPSDVATFGPSNTTGISISASVQVSTIEFRADAPSFTTSVDGIGINLIVTGEGIMNESGTPQSFIDGGQSAIFFFNNATAGDLTIFSGEAGQFSLNDSASAGSATFLISSGGITQGHLFFFDNSTAADATIALSNFAIASIGDTASTGNAVFTATTGAAVLYGTSSTADHSIITCSSGGGIGFNQTSTAAQGHFTANGATSSSESACYIDFANSTTAADATIVLNGGEASGAPGAEMTFFGSATAGNATVTVNGGASGGEGATVLFNSTTDGGTASVALHGNGSLDISPHQAKPLTIGSLEGDGLVLLGARTLAVGSNNRKTTFSGVIEDGGSGGGTGGSLTKVGTGLLTLSGANTYSGGTTLSAGGLVIWNATGSGTGAGPVQVNGGTLAGAGLMAGPVTIGSGSGSGAILAPGQGASRLTTLSTASTLTFKSDATYRYRLNVKKRKSDLVIANGVTIQSGAQFNFQAIGRDRLRPGKVATVISNTSATPIAGAFANLPEGSTLEAGGNNLRVSYHGGDGNDLTLTVLP